MNIIFDTHAHYDDSAFDIDREKVLNSLKDKGICAVINAGSDVESSKESIHLAEKYKYIYAAVGVHPQSVKTSWNSDIKIIEQLLSHEKVVAIGEIGLDYYHDSQYKDLQLSMFESQLKLASEMDFPVIVHDREAHSDTMSLLRKYNPRGVIHCFSGSVEMAQEVIKLGMYIGIGGVITFKNAKNPLNVVKNIPLKSILLETDSPYMTPVPYRGKRCDSSYIPFTAQKLAEIKQCTVEEVFNTTKNNSMKLFNIKGV